MGVSAAIMTMGGGLINAYSQNQAGKLNERLANLNANMSEFAAQDAIDRGKEVEEEVRTQTKMIIGSQRSRYGASNIDVNSGSAIEVQASTEGEGEIDALTVRSNALREALGYRIHGIDYRLSGALSRFQGRSQSTGTLLSSGSQAYYMRYGRQ